MEARSFLFVPAVAEHMYKKALAAGADAVVFDLEDAVAANAKDAARKQLCRWLQELEGQREPLGTVRPRLYVRVNDVDSPYSFDDLTALSTLAAIDGIMLPKVETVRHVVIAAWVLRQGERTAGLAAKELLPLIESARGLIAIAALAAAARDRVRRVALGTVDFCLDVGIAAGPHGLEQLSFARSTLVIQSRAADLQPPIDGVWTNLNDLAGLEAEAAAARRHGFGGKLAIHPNQVDTINRVFHARETERDWARRIVAVYEAAHRDGVASIRVGDEFVDHAIYKRALQILGEVGPG